MYTIYLIIFFFIYLYIFINFSKKIYKNLFINQNINNIKIYIFIFLIYFFIIEENVLLCCNDDFLEEKSEETLPSIETFIFRNEIMEMNNIYTNNTININNNLVNRYLELYMSSENFYTEKNIKECISITDQLYSIFVDNNINFKIKINKLIYFLEINEESLKYLKKQNTNTNINFENELNKIENQKKKLITNKDLYKPLFDIKQLMK